MKCECGAISTVLVEHEDGTVTPMCEACYYKVKYGDESECTCSDETEGFQCIHCQEMRHGV